VSHALRLGLLLALTFSCSAAPRYRRPPADPTPDARTAANPGAPSTSQQPSKISTKGAYQVGRASYYAHKFHGRLTANGETFDMYGMTAAHRELPLGSTIRVTHLGNGKHVKVRVNDRGPFVTGRILDLSLGAAKQLEMVSEGVARVKIEILQLAD